jgi:hypothetical protein
MSIQRSLLLVACAGAALVTALVLLAALRAPASSARGSGSPDAIAKRLVGHWTGQKVGAEANRFRSDRWDLIFVRASGPALIGRKRHRENGHWTAFEQIDAVVDSAGHIWAVDTDGDINGALRSNGTLELVYQEPGTSDAAAAVVRLRRAG